MGLVRLERPDGALNVGTQLKCCLSEGTRPWGHRHSRLGNVSSSVVPEFSGRQATLLQELVQCHEMCVHVCPCHLVSFDLRSQLEKQARVVPGPQQELRSGGQELLLAQLCPTPEKDT